MFFSSFTAPRRFNQRSLKKNCICFLPRTSWKSCLTVWDAWQNWCNLDCDLSHSAPASIMSSSCTFTVQTLASTLTFRTLLGYNRCSSDSLSYRKWLWTCVCVWNEVEMFEIISTELWMLNNLSEPASSTAAIDHYVSVTENKSVHAHFFAAVRLVLMSTSILHAVWSTATAIKTR